MKVEKLKSIVRRLTPLECERLMGFPDNYLDIGDGKGGKTSDSPRYKACGNSWGVNSAAWITQRIQLVDRLLGDRGITNYATVCSGVEAQSLALKACGIKAKGIFFSEIEPFPCRVLAHHYPEVPNLGDMTKIQINERTITNGSTDIIRPDELDLFSGGTPCQDFSVAGKRAGAERGSGTRSSLMWTYLDLVASLKARWLLWENVPGCLSSNGGKDFAGFLQSLGELGYSVAYRTLDVQYTRMDAFPLAIPQRRRRVWVVGHLGADGDGCGLPPPVQVLFEPTRLLGDNPPRRVKGQGVADGSRGSIEGASEDVGER